MKILLVQTSFLGDTVLSTPVIAGLKQLHPQAELWILTTPLGKQLVERDPLLAGVLTFDKRGAEAGLRGLWRKIRALKRMNFDRAYSLHRSARTSLMLALSGISERVGFETATLSWLYTQRLSRQALQHDVLRNLGLLAREGAAETLSQELRLFAPAAESLSPPVREIVDSPGYVLLVPGSAWPTKMWHWEGYRDVALHFLSKGIRVVVAGAPDERAVGEKVCTGNSAVNLAGKTSVAEQLALVKHAGLVICNDSMALHVASAFKRPTVAVFCATSPEFGFGPWRSPARVVQVDGLDCKPCRRHGGRYCPTGTQACMQNLKAHTVLAAAAEIFRS